MVDISRETRGQTEARLRAVMRLARADFLDGPYRYHEFPDDRFPAAARRDALALVRDGDRWSQLVPADDEAGERFALFGFHFPAGMDNSGFVGWLASLLKEALGSGVLVVCGMNRDDGGIFDYWGVPFSIRDDAFRAIRALTGDDGRAPSPAARPNDA